MMNMVQKRVQSARTFFGEVGQELRKCAWPSARELRESSVVIVVAVLMLAAYIGLCDAVMLGLIGALVGR
jgi:preprotein translocase subunit SecE